MTTQTTLLTSEPEAIQLTATETTPLTILERAVERGLDAEQLEKLMAMQERWERNQAAKAFAEAMHSCQQEMPAVGKVRENRQTKSTYAALEDLQSQCRPVYARHGFSLSFGEADCPTANYKRTVCEVRHVGGHCASYHLDLPIDGVGAKGNPIGAMNPVQACISTTSYGQRRLFAMIFNITLAGEDDDGQSVSCISDQQCATLREWIEASGADEPRYLKALGVESLATIACRDFTKALQMLKDKAATKR